MKHIKTLNRSTARVNGDRSDCSRRRSAGTPACRNSCTVTVRKDTEKKQSE